MACDLPRLLDADGDPLTWREGDTTPTIRFTLQGGDLAADFELTLFVRRPDGTLLEIVGADLGGSEGEFVWLADSLQAGRVRKATHRVINRPRMGVLPIEMGH